MIEIKGNLWEIKADAKCITTNGFIKTNGEAVMGRGIAAQAKTKFPELPRILGKHIKEYGNIPGLLNFTGQFSIWSFPVKHNWWESADIDLIVKSAKYMMTQADKFKYESIIIPRPGCGNGQLEWNIVGHYLVNLLDNRFQIINL